MSSPGGNRGGLNSDDQSNKVAGDPNQAVSLPVSLSVPCEDVGTDENLLDMNNKKLNEEIARTNQIHLADIHVENQQLFEEILKQTAKNNATLEKQSELYNKLILGASKRLFGHEKTSEAGSKKFRNLNPEDDRSSEDQKD